MITKAPREGASLITSRSELGGYRGGGGRVGQDWWVFSAIPHLELGKTPSPKGPVLGQIAVLLGKWLFRRPKENRPPLMLLMLAWACCLMLLMLAWACRLHMSQHDCLSLSGTEFIC